MAGFDVFAEPQEVRRRIGVSGQYAAVDEYLTGYENLEMVGRLYHLGRAEAKARAEAASRVARCAFQAVSRRARLSATRTRAPQRASHCAIASPDSPSPSTSASLPL